MVELAQIDQFFDDGFFIAKQQIIEKELEDLREAFDHLRTKAESNNEIYNLRYNFMGNGDWDSWGVNDIFHPSLYDKRFDDYLANTHVLGIVSKILGDELRFGAAHALWGPKKVDYNLYWHRDGGQLDLFTPSGKSNHVQYNLALDYDACFYVIPGSHRRPLSRQEYDEARKCGNGSLPGEVRVICEPGDVLFMNSWTLHRGSCKAGITRRTLHFNLQPKYELNGGRNVPSWMRNNSYLNNLNPQVRELFENLIEWNNREFRTVVKRIRENQR